MSSAGIVSWEVGLQTSEYFNIAGLAILIFDYVITLEDEARWVWGRSWDATRVVFNISRYVPFAGAGMTAYAALRSNSDPCGPTSTLYVHMLGIIAAEVLLVLRTYAYWDGDKRVLYGLFAYGGVTIAAVVGINFIPIQINTGISQGPPGCSLTTGPKGALVYLFLLIFETVILFFTVYKRFRSYREVRTSIVYTIFRDGLIYLICMMLITLANTIVEGAFPLQFSDLFELLQITLHSVLASRITFNLRKSSYCTQTGTSMDSIVFNDNAFYSPLEAV